MALRGRFHREGPSDEGLTTKFQLRSRNYTVGIKSSIFQLRSSFQYEIVSDWINFVVLNNRVERKIITQRIK
jgi:hypothetical protein